MMDDNVDEVRAMIGTALANEPPIGIDYDAVRSAGRRRRLARRNAGFLGGAVLGVVAIATAAVTVGQLVAGPSTTPAGLRPADAGCVVPARTSGFSTAANGTASQEELAESERLTKAFARLVLPLPRGVTAEPGNPKLCVISESWGARLALHSGELARDLYIDVRARAGEAPSACQILGPSCTSRVLQDGTSIVIDQGLLGFPDRPAAVEVQAWRPDVTVVRVTETWTEGFPNRPRILDDDALIKIATAPELRVRWSGAKSRLATSDRRAAELSDVLAKGEILPQSMRPSAPLVFVPSEPGYLLEVDLVDRAGAGHLTVSVMPKAPAYQS